MHTIRRLVIMAVLPAFVLAGCAGITSKTQPHTLSVTGVGLAHQPPDMALLTLGVHTEGPDVGSAVQDNNQRTAKVMQAIEAAGVPKADIRTSFFSVMSQPVYDDKGMPTGAVKYTADNTITVTLRQITKLSSLLQDAISQGANNVQQVSYGAEDQTKALQQARDLAMQDARRQAEALAKTAGIQLGEPLTVTEGSAGTVPYGAILYGKGGGGGVPAAPGTVDVQVQVTISYLLP